MSRNKALAALWMTGCMLLSSCQAGGTQTVQTPGELAVPRQVNYITTQVQTGTYAKVRQGSASAAYPVSVELAAEGADVCFREYQVRRGDTVKKGDVLCTFEVIEDEVELETRRLRLTRAREAYASGKATRLLALEQAQQALEDSRRDAQDPLAAHRLQIQRLNMEKKQVEYQQFVYQSEKEIGELQAQLDQLEGSITITRLTAPFDGRVDRIGSRRTGERVESGEVLVSVVSTEFAFIKIDNAGDTIRYNMEITLEAGPRNDRRTYQGCVVSAGNILPDDTEHSYALIRVEETFFELDQKYRENIQYSCHVQELQNVLLVDNRALQEEDKESFVYVLEDGGLHKRYVTVGLNNPDMTWVLDGLQEGQTLVLG